MPQELIAKIKKAATFNQGFATTEFLASALMDMKYHTTDPATINPKEFEKEMLAQLNMPEEIVMRHRTPILVTCFQEKGMLPHIMDTCGRTC